MSEMQQIQLLIYVIKSQQIYNKMQVPQQTYRWLVSIKIIENQGEIGDKGLVSIPSSAIPLFEVGYSIAQIVKSILKRQGLATPISLDNVRKQINKNVKQTNWNFIWVSFDDLRMQFDNRIKDLILQGQNALIVEIIKQLCDRDQNKDEEKMNEIIIHDNKKETQKIQKSIKPPAKGGALDIKKINLQKNPNESQSSLQFLILLLSSSLQMTVQQILGLFTNQNKYLAHIIVKGINDDYSGVLLFYTLLNKYSTKLKSFVQQDKKDAESCLYAIKPGFISKNQQVTELTLALFSKVGNIYNWLVSETGKGSTTLLLGIKRHPNLAGQFWQLLSNLIKNEQAQFFTSQFKQSFKDSREMLQICQILAKPIGESYIRDKLLQLGILAEWIQIAVNMFQNQIDDQILCITFLGEMMLNLPDSVIQNQQCLTTLGKGWKQRKVIHFVLLIDEILTVLTKLAANRNHFASKIYQTIIQIFQEISTDKLKKQYLVQNFALLIPQFPKMPVQYFIQVYTQNSIDSSDFDLIRTAIYNSQDIQGLARIGQVLLRLFNFNAVLNGFVASLIYTIAKKIFHDEIGQAFVRKSIRQCLHSNSLIQTQKKIPQVSKPQPMYFGRQGNSQKLSQQEMNSYKTKQKQSFNLIQLVDKLCELAKSLDNLQLTIQIKQQLLQSNSFIRKGNFKVSSKGVQALLRKFNISKEEEQQYDEDYRTKKSAANMQDSIAKKKSLLNNISVLSTSKIGPEHIRKQFTQIIQKRKRQEEQKKAQQQKKQKEEALKLAQAKKQLQRQQLLRGFGSGQAQLKQQGFWNKLIKQDKQTQLYPPALMQTRDTDYIDNLFKKFHRVTRYIFLKYSNSMYTVKSVNNFEDNQLRKQTLNLTEAIKFLKQYKLYFLTSNTQIQNLIRDINVKLLNKRQTQQLDFAGFQNFLVQFSAIIFTKTHTINTKTAKGTQNVQKSLNHLSHAQLLQELFNYIRLVFIERGEKTTMFDEPEAAYFNESQIIKEFNKKVQDDPTFILPEGYVKVTDKVITFFPVVSQNIIKGMNPSYLDVLEVLDQILHQSQLKIHILEPISDKSTKTRVKPHAFVNVKPKLLTDSMMGENKIRALSSAIQRKVPAIPPTKILQRKVLSFGMKLGLSYVSYKDKLLGEQVAYVIDDMITAIQNGKNNIQKQKIMNQVIKRRSMASDMERKLQSQKDKKRKQRKDQLQKMKKQHQQKKKKQQQQAKEQKQKQKQKEIQKQKKKKEDTQKYLSEQKAKIKQKKTKQEQQKAKQQEEKKKKKQGDKKSKQAFEQFNKKQIEKFKKGVQEISEQKKKQKEKQEQQKKQKQQLYKKLRSKISTQDRKVIELRQKNNQQIQQLFSSPQIAEVFKKFQPNLKGLFDFLIKSTHLSLTQRKHNNQVILQTWNYFVIAFQINPYIINSKNALNIFKSLTKDKQVSKQYYLGLSFQQFEQALLRIAIKHKTVFNKISQKIKQNDMSQKQIDAVIDKDIQEKQKNQFDEPKEIDVKGLLVQDDINKEVFDDYGQIKKVTPNTIKGLIYYLKVPKEKAGQQKRWRQVIGRKDKYMQKYEKLKQKLKEQYTLQSPNPKKKTEAAKSKEKVEPQPQPEPEPTKDQKKPTKKKSTQKLKQ